MNSNQIDQTVYASKNFLELCVELVKDAIESSDPGDLNKKELIYKQRLKLFALKEDVKEDISDIRSRLDIPQNGFEDLEGLMSWLNNKTDSSNDTNSSQLFGNLIGRFAQKYKVGSRWDIAITAFLFFDEVEHKNLLPKPIEVNPINISDARESGDYVDVRIHPEASQDDLIDSWKQIKDKRSWVDVDGEDLPDLPEDATKQDQSNWEDWIKSAHRNHGVNLSDIKELIDTTSEFDKSLSKRNKTLDPDNLDRNIKALELKRNGKTHEEIAQILMGEGFVEFCVESDVSNYLKEIRQKVERVHLR